MTDSTRAEDCFKDSNRTSNAIIIAGAAMTSGGLWAWGGGGAFFGFGLWLTLVAITDGITESIEKPR